MNDFLHSLRSNKDKRFDRNRRNYESPSYRTNDRQNNAEKRRKGPYRPQQNEQAQAYAAINKLLPTIKTLLESLNEDRKKLIEAEERKAVAMEAIATFLGQLSGSPETLPVLESIESICENETCAPVQESLSENDADSELPELKSGAETDKIDPSPDSEPQQTLSRDDLIDMITRLRQDGFSYEKIARHLEDNSIPTISGRGKWRGQAVSKLCQ